MQFTFAIRVLLFACAVVSAKLVSAQDAPPAAPAEKSEATAPVEVARENLLKYKEMPLPTAEELLTQKPRDWVVLLNDDVLVVEPLIPRPGTLETRRQEIAAKTEARGKILGEKRELLDREIAELNTFIVTLSKGMDSKEFRLPVRQVKQIIHQEDLMLRRIEQLLTEKKVDTAFELLTQLERVRPDWPGVKEAGLKVLELSAYDKLKSHQPADALALLEELRLRNPKHPDVLTLIGDAVRQQVETALADQQFAEAQHYLHSLRDRSPEHPVFLEFADKLNQTAIDRMQLATQAFQKNDFRSAVIEAEQAVRIWPPAKELKAPYIQYASRYQRLHVGVTELPGERKAYPVPSMSDLRQDQLTKLKLFEMARLRDGTAYYRTRFFDEWEPRDLGRQIRFKLQQSRQPFALHASPSSLEVITPILQRLDPLQPEFDDRLASFIESVTVISPTEFTITFRRVPPRVEPLLAEITLLPPTAGETNESPHKSPGGFRLFQQTANECDYVRSIPEPDGSRRFHVAEVVEHRFDSPARLVNALRNGDVSFACGLPDVELRSLQQDEDFNRNFFLQPCLLPITHLLQFNPASPPLRIAELRKGLGYAVDADRLLRQVVLQDPRAQHGRLVTTPFFSGSAGRNPGVVPRQFDLSNAFALTMAARQQFKKPLPPLTMIVAPDSVAVAAAEEIVKNWRRIGLEINVIQASDPPPEHWDILYRTLEMHEPVLEMWPFLTFSDRARIDELRPYPDWLKQELVQMDRTGDQGRAVDALQVLHKHLWEQAAYIPLWEVDQFVVLRKNIQGFPQKFTNSYDEIEHWRVEPWYRETLP